MSFEVSHVESRRKILSRSVIAVGIVGFIVALLVTSIYYRVVYDQRKQQLVEVANTHANFIGAVARFDAIHSQQDHPLGARAATLSQILDAQTHYTGFGKTGEYVLAERIGNEIDILLSKNSKPGVPHKIAWDSKGGEALRRALEGKAGVMEGLDHNNKVVLAAYQPVPDLNVGIVAKISVDELRQPFIWAASASAGIAMLLIALGVLMVHRLVGTPLRQIGESFSKIEAAKNAKDQFLASVSHEIRNPINVIQGFTNMLESERPPEEVEQALKAIKRNVSHLLTIVNDVLDLAKAEANELRLEQVPCSPVRVLDETIVLLDGAAKAKGIDLLVEYHGILPSVITTDPIRLKQILFNLVSNAIKFTPKGFVKVVARARVSAEAHNQTILEFDIEDSGIGMSGDEVAKIFKPFRQADKNIATTYGGSGIGLYLSKLLVERLGGEIQVSSAPGKGSKFKVVLRVETSSVPNQPARSAGVELRS
jgi:signal transduction histidine kinase